MKKDIKIAAKKIAAKVSPYYLYRRRSLQPKIASLIEALRPMQTEHELTRIGEGTDGAYVVPDDFAGIKYCFSPGVDDRVLFEKHLHEAYGIDSFLCDYSVERPSADFQFEFDKKFVGAHCDDVFITMDAWFGKYLGDSTTDDMILQMDIEGGEYATLLSTPQRLLDRFRIIVIEFHHLFKLLDYAAFPMIEATFMRLLATHVAVHIHPNNYQGSIKTGNLEIPDAVEMTFLRRDRATQLSPANVFPHPLDRECDPRRKPLVLPKCWYDR